MKTMSKARSILEMMAMEEEAHVDQLSDYVKENFPGKDVNVDIYPADEDGTALEVSFDPAIDITAEQIADAIGVPAEMVEDEGEGFFAVYLDTDEAEESLKEAIEESSKADMVRVKEYGMGAVKKMKAMKASSGKGFKVVMKDGKISKVKMSAKEMAARKKAAKFLHKGGSVKAAMKSRKLNMKKSWSKIKI
jgi:rubrerythrin